MRARRRLLFDPVDSNIGRLNVSVSGAASPGRAEGQPGSLPRQAGEGAGREVWSDCCGSFGRGIGKVTHFPGNDRDFENEPRDSLKGNHRGWCIGVIAVFPAEN